MIASAAVPALGEDAALSEDDSDHLDEEKAFLIVRKSATPKETVVGSNMTVVIEVHNAGARYLVCLIVLNVVPEHRSALSGPPTPCMANALVNCARAMATRCQETGQMLMR